MVIYCDRDRILFDVFAAVINSEAARSVGGAGGREKARSRLEQNIPANPPGWQCNKLNSESFVMLWCVCVARVLKRRVLFTVLPA